MKILDPGHKFQLEHLDGENKSILTFVKREGENYPGNIGHHEGTNLQEVLRALISRMKYLEGQIPDNRNLACIDYMRNCIWLLEDRAAERHNRSFDFYPTGIELEETCNICGHIGCIGECH